MLQRILGIAGICAVSVNVVAGRDEVTAVDPGAFLTRSATCNAQNRATGETKEIQICVYHSLKTLTKLLIYLLSS